MHYRFAIVLSLTLLAVALGGCTEPQPATLIEADVDDVTNVSSGYRVDGDVVISGRSLDIVVSGTQVEILTQNGTIFDTIDIGTMNAADRLSYGYNKTVSQFPYYIRVRYDSVDNPDELDETLGSKFVQRTQGGYQYTQYDNYTAEY